MLPSLTLPNCSHSWQDNKVNQKVRPRSQAFAPQGRAGTTSFPEHSCAGLRGRFNSEFQFTLADQQSYSAQPLTNPASAAPRAALCFLPQVAKAVLGRCGCTVTVANDGLEALLLVKEGNAFDIIFMDLGA